MSAKGISETLLRASKIRIKKDRVQFIRENATDALRWIVHCAYNPVAISLLPKGRPPFNECSDLETFGNLYHRISDLKLFFKGYKDNMSDKDRQNLFISLLEAVHPDDARLLIAVKDKTIPYPFMTYGFFKEAFPDWLPDRTEKTWVIEGATNDESE
jgi:hypothetical protein